MKHTLLATTALAVLGTGAFAGGIERTGSDYSILFDEGSVVELGFSTVRPSIEGAYPAALGGGTTGNMAEGYSSVSLAYKTELNSNLDVALILNQPFGADALYPSGPYAGLGANWDSQAVSVVGRYSFGNGFSAYGGVRYHKSEASIAIPDALIRSGLAAAPAATGGPAIAGGAPAGTLAYTASTDSASDTNFIVGAAYERPDIALRVALTYESGSTYDFVSDESIPAFGVLPGTAPLNSLGDQRFSIEMPKTIRLDFQSGVAQNTLVFGSIQYQDWSVWDVRPDGYAAVTGGSVTSLDNNVTSLSLGGARRLNDSLALVGSLGYEKSNGGVASRLAPSDGKRSISLGAVYTMDQVEISGGVSYVKLGDTVDGSGVVFSGSKAVGVGLKVGYKF